MRILLDECLPRKLGLLLAGYESVTVPECGWAGVKNGNLLQLAESQFDIFLTVDRNLQFQNPTAVFDLAIVVLRSKSNRLKDLQQFVPSARDPYEASEGHMTFHLP